MNLQFSIDEPPALVIDGEFVPLTTPVHELRRAARPTRVAQRPTMGVKTIFDGMDEWRFGSDGLFFIVGTRLEVVTVTWRDFGIGRSAEDGQIVGDTSAITTSAGFSLEDTYEDLLRIHGAPTQTRLDIFHALDRQHLEVEYELFDGSEDFVYFRASFENMLARGIQFARASAF